MWRCTNRLILFLDGDKARYGNILVVRVHQLVPEVFWKKRYEQINNFAKMLSGTATIILKFFLHNSERA
jgi:polyphosphate kinase 2 (PPK2 family)